LDIPTSIFGDAAVSTEGFQSSVLFHFIITKEIPTADPNSPDHCLQLPPSVELGSVFVDEVSGKRFAQPSINYELRALVCFAAQDEVNILTVEMTIPIIITPHTKEFPPTSTHDFPAEFKEVESKPLRASMFGRPTGTMSASLSEPRPLTYKSSSVCAVTEAQLDLEFSPADLGDAVQTLQAIKFTLHSAIRAKTFYGIESFPRLPSQTLVGVHGQTKMRDDLIKLPTREFSGTQWVFKYNSGDPSDDNWDVPPGSLVDSITSQNGASTEIRSPRPSQAHNGRCIATIRHPIRVESPLLPTFCSAIAARLYTVILRLKVSGIRRESFDLEVPLQVINMPPEGVTYDAGVLDHTINGPAVDDPLLFDRRSSATSWFSDESLVRHLSPSKCHPQ